MTEPTPLRTELEMPGPKLVEAPKAYRIPLFRMTDLPNGFKASEQDRRKT